MPMHWTEGLLLVGAGVGSMIATWSVRRTAIRFGLIDRPNDRSSHVAATPRGGGIAIVVCSWLAAGILATQYPHLRNAFYALGIGGGIVAAIGLVDDVRSLSAAVRLVAHLCAASVLVALVGTAALDPLPTPPYWLALPLTVLTCVWVLNLFNFMDGIDGIAAAQAVFMLASAAFLIGEASAAAHEFSLLCLGLAAAVTGFLVFNLPPAKIFMGDVGSGFVGYQLVVLAVASSRMELTSVWVWMVLGALFLGDATATLIRRLLTGKRMMTAHRSHLYQRLALRWRSHARATAAYSIVNVLIVLPLAALAHVRPQSAAVIAAFAIFASIISAAALGAGRDD